jgi:hypothetical protein
MEKLPPLSVFCSYSQEDMKRLLKTVKGLASLQPGWIDPVWYDRKMLVGTAWEQELLKRLQQSDLIFMFVTNNFFSSAYCMKELDIAIARHEKRSARIVPIILEASNWKVSRLGAFQALPKSGVPIFRGSYCDMARLEEVSQGILAAIKEFCSNGNGQAARVPAALDSSQTVLAQLCNRVNQDKQLRDAWDDHFRSFSLRRRPFVCLVHGSLQQDHPGYLKRLTAYSLPQALKLGADSEIRNPLRVKWPDYSPDEDAKSPLLLRSLARELNCPAEIKECAATLYRLGQACVVYHELPSSSRNYANRAALESLFRFWADWPDLPVLQKLIVVLSVQYQPGFPAGFPKVEADIVDNAKKDGKMSAVILDELPSVSSSQVKEWMRLQEIANFCDVENNVAAWEAEIDDMFLDRPQIPMLQLIGPLNQMLNQYQRRPL